VVHPVEEAVPCDARHGAVTGSRRDLNGRTNELDRGARLASASAWGRRERPSGGVADREPSEVRYGSPPRPTGGVNALTLVVTAVVGGATYTGALAVAPRLPQILPALPVFYAFAIAACVVATYLLTVRARASNDELLRWMGWGYGLAGVAMALQIVGFPTISPGGGPLRTTSAGAAGLYLVWHTVVPVFALLAVAHHRLTPRVRAAAVITALALVLYVASGASALPTYLTADGRYTPQLVNTIAALALLSLLSTIVWARAAGRRPAWTTAWITVSLAFGTWDLMLHTFADERFTVFWWASLSMRVAQFVVLAAGLLAGFVGLFRALDTYSTSLSVRLEHEAERARSEHAELTTRQVAVSEATQRIRAVLTDPHDIQMVFQPIVELRTNNVVGVEALARFAADPPRPPDEWFNEAASIGLGVELELAAIRVAVAHFDTLPEHLYLAVNLSPEAAVSPGLHDCLDAVPLDRLVLEITEHAPVTNYDRLSLALEPLRARGCRVAIDDAGAGFASFRHILRLAPDVIKLDMSLTRDIERDPVKVALARSLVEFAAESRAVIVAEGMENADQIATLSGLGATYAQGYYLGRPAALPAAGLIAAVA
jgi:EAL domain-containing protein (putative c-di-GMP-specific phosphodiesterase class I)